MKTVHIGIVFLLCMLLPGFSACRPSAKDPCAKVAPAIWGKAGDEARFSEASEIVKCYDWVLVGQKK